MNIYQVLKIHSLTLGGVFHLSDVCNDFKRINDFKKGDIIACVDGDQYLQLCIVELVTDHVNVNEIQNCISKNSMMPLTSHLISAKWFKVN